MCDDSINVHQQHHKGPAYQLHPSLTAATHILQPTTTILWPIRTLPSPESDRKEEGCEKKHHSGVLECRQQFWEGRRGRGMDVIDPFPKIR